MDTVTVTHTHHLFTYPLALVTTADIISAVIISVGTAGTTVTTKS
jgi:cysteine synthase